MEFFGFVLFLLMGLTLGLIGAGGSILTIPILVYVYKMPVLLSSTYSLFIVGWSACLGMLRYKNAIAFNKAFLFAIPSLTGVFISRFYFVPLLPEYILTLSRDSFLLFLLSIVMLLAALLMVSDRPPKKAHPTLTLPTILSIVCFGTSLGMLVGLLGTGGGFLIIPTLVLLLGVEMNQAVATSLFIIMLNSAIGFFADHQSLDITQYKKLFFFTALAMCGMWVGTLLSPKTSNEKLRKRFGYFIAVVALLIAAKELYNS